MNKRTKPNQILILTLYFIVLTFLFQLQTTNTSSINSYKDIQSRTRKGTFISFDSIQKMLERVIEDSDVSSFIGWEVLYKKTNRPERVIEEYLTVQSNRSKVNNAMKLLCFNLNDNQNDLSQFDFDVFIEQSFSQSDKDVIKSTFYAFREIYSFFSMGKSIESLFSTNNLNDLDFMCDEEIFNTSNPSSFFIKNENKLKNLKVKPIFSVENRLVGHLFYLNLRPSVEDSVLNVAFQKLLDDEEFVFNSLEGKGGEEFLFEFGFYSESFNGVNDHILSSKRYVLSSSIRKTNDSNEELNELNELNLIYSNMILEYQILERLINISYSFFKYNHSVLFKLYFNPSYAFKYIINNNNLQKNSTLNHVKPTKSINSINFNEEFLYLPISNTVNSNQTELNEKTNQFLSIELGLLLNKNIDDLHSSEKSLFDQMKAFSQTIINSQSMTQSQITHSNNVIEHISSKSNDLYYLKSELWKCDDKLFSYYKQFKSDGNEYNFDDNEYIVKSIMSLCLYKKAINQMKNDISHQINKKFNVYLIENQVFYENLIFSIRLIQPEAFVISSYVYKVHSLVNCLSISSCFNTNSNNKEASIVFLSNLIHISKYFNSLYDIFDVYTTNYMNHLNYAKYILYKSFIETFVSFKSLLSLLDTDCQVFDLTVEGDGKNIQFTNIVEFYSLVNSLSLMKGLDVEDKVGYFRNLFYSFYYDSTVPFSEDENLVKSIGRKIIYTDFFKNSHFLRLFYESFGEVVKCIHMKYIKYIKKEDSEKENQKADL